MGLRWKTVTGATIFLGLSGGLRSVEAESMRPDIIVILVDDMGFSDLGCYGGEARTPHLDALAENGIRFRHFYNTARCSPTRASILTGLYSHQVADDPDRNLPNLREDNNITLAELLRHNGYRTYMAGKWHLGQTGGMTPWSRGFQHTFGFRASGAANAADYWDPREYRLTSENNEISPREYGLEPYDFYQTDALADYSIDFIDHHISHGDDAPFFLYLAPRAPHWDLAAPAETADYVPPGGESYVDIYSRGWDVIRQQRHERMQKLGVIDERYVLPPFDDVPAPRQQYEPVPRWDTLDADRQADLARRMAIYTAMVDHLDQMVGRIVEHLRMTGRLDNTLILFLSDNGACAEGGVFGGSAFGRDPLTGDRLRNMGQPYVDDRLKQGGGWAVVSNTPLRLYKKFNHEGGINTSLVVHWPAGIRDPGRWSNQVGHVMDVMRTVVEITGFEYPAEFNGNRILPMEGASLLPVFRNEALFERQIGFEHETNRAWIDGRWKMVTQNFDTTDGGIRAHEVALYDLESDPVEMNNLAASHPERLAAMVEAWNRWALRVGRSPTVLLGAETLAATQEAVRPEDFGAQRFLLMDPVEESDGWALAGGVGAIGIRGVTPTAGDAYFNFTINPGERPPFGNRAAFKDAGTVLKGGATYTVVADFNQALANRPFIGDEFTGPVSERVSFGFFDPEGIDFAANDNGERLKIRDAINAVLLNARETLVWHERTIPDGGAWQTWSYSFTLPEDSAYAGRPLWFGVYGGHLGADRQRSLAFDNLRVFIREKGSP